MYCMSSLTCSVCPLSHVKLHRQFTTLQFLPSIRLYLTFTNPPSLHTHVHTFFCLIRSLRAEFNFRFQIGATVQNSDRPICGRSGIHTHTHTQTDAMGRSMVPAQRRKEKDKRNLLKISGREITCQLQN